MKKSIFILLLLHTIFIGCVGCSSDDSENPANDDGEIENPVDGGTSEGAQLLLSNLNLNALQGKILVGHQGTTIAGVGWRLWQMPDYSDFKAVSGKFPSVYGWEFSPRPDNWNTTYDYVSFDTTIDEAQKAFYRGGINTFSLHLFRLDNNAYSWDNTPGLVPKLIPGGNLHDSYKELLDKIIVELKKLKDNSGKPIPFIFRPFHEANHNWFWWGSTACSNEEYKTLFRFTIEYIRGKGLNNMLVCYAPGYFQNQATYLQRYPGDDIVDILGFDGYYGNNNGHGVDWETLKNHLIQLKTLGESKNKPIAWTETGEQNLATSNYFTQLAQSIQEVNINLAYLMFWVNYETTEYYIPYPDLNNNPLKTDFLNFVQSEKYQIEGEHMNLYQ